MKTIIIYESTHHGKTKKLVDAVAQRYEIKTVTVEEASRADLKAYDRIGIASGVVLGNFMKPRNGLWRSACRKE
jgi:menaquinone-dependent protoporphyrinogen IX oxidase|nr:flavodoxin domain-containing protein [uncultured Acetatifactor sp.]